jgi:RnfABCDGE-type electron transport complex D subunit
MSEISASDLIASPHAHGGGSVSLTMRRVMYALTPATVFGLWLFGWPAINIFAITVASCMFFEFVSQRLMGQRTTLGDGSAMLTGWLLALTMPPWAPWWTGVVGGFIAIVVGKQVFGGLGQNLFNPAMVARVALLVSFPVVMTQWVAPQPLTAAEAPGFVDGVRITLTSPPVPDAIASASLLGHVKTEMARGLDLPHAFAEPKAPVTSATGMRAGSLGESASLLIVAGGLYLFFLGVIGWQIPLAVIAGIGIPAAIAHGVDPTRYLSAGSHLMSGAAMLGAFFIATDYVSSPNTSVGQLIFGLGVGLMTWIIRTWGGYPEGMAFAVLLMNALTPVIDRYVKPRILGRRRDGRELEPVQS